MEKLLKELRENNIALSLNNSDLKVRFNGSALAEGIVKEIKDNKVMQINGSSGLVSIVE